jgi:cystathionine beta-lyase/cystathionine gamma-synthase
VSAPKFDRAGLSAVTRDLHDAIDDHARRSGVAWLHPSSPTLQRDLLGGDAMIAWQEGKSAAVWRGETCWSELPPVYARYGTDGSRALIAGLRSLYEAAGALVVDSGMQAVGVLADGLLAPGAHVVIVGQVYNKTRSLLAWATARLGGSLTEVPHGDLARLAEACQEQTALVFWEQCTNPLLRVHDVAAMVAVIRERCGARIAADDTISTVWGPRSPLLGQGVDVVLGAGTKALGGEDTALWGYVVSNQPALLNPLMDVVAMRGGALDGPRAAAIAAGLDRAAAAFVRRSESAVRVATWLAAQDAVEHVWHPSVADHPDHAVAGRDLARQPSLLSFRVRGLDDDGHRHLADVIAMTGVVRYALSFDGLVTKVNHHTTVSEYFTPPPVLRRQGLDRLVRLGVGVEDAADLIACLGWALGAAPQLSRGEVVAWAAARSEALGLTGHS